MAATDAPDFSNATLRRLKAALPYLVTAALFGLGLYALRALLSEVSLPQVMAQVRATPWTTLALAFMATMGGYAALIGYDWSGLRHIGKPLPFPVVAAGGFMAYAFGNTIGLSALSGGAVRYRIYGALGLDGYDVAAVSTFAAVSFGVAATTVGLAALALHPEALAALSPLSPGGTRWAALAALAALALPLAAAAVTQGAFRLGRFTVRAPSLPVLGAQVVFSLGDISLSALTLYLLLPASDLSFAGFLAVFAAATMAGVVSHVPGGVGVFEAVVLAALPATVSLDQAAAALLLYRVIYYFTPFALALALLSLNEARMALLRLAGVDAVSAVTPVFRAVSAVAPLALSAMVFGSGLWMMFGALIPGAQEAAEELEILAPLDFVAGRALISSAIGAGLVVIALGLAQRIEGAWWLAMAALLAGAGASLEAALTTGRELDRALLLLAAALLLAPGRREFHRAGRLTRGVLTPGWLALVAGAVAACGFVLYFAQRSGPFAHEQWWVFALDERAPLRLRAGLVASLAAALGLLGWGLRGARLRPQAPDAAALAAAARIAAAQDEPLALLALTGDKALLMSDEGDALMSFGARGRAWVALGAPVGPPDGAARLAWAFADAARREGARPAFFAVGRRHAPLMLDLGLSLSLIGEEAMLPLPGFTLDAPARRRLRAAHERAVRAGLTLERARPPHAAAPPDALAAIGELWAMDRAAPERGFLGGPAAPGWLAGRELALIRRHDAVVGFAVLLVAGPRAAVDVIRHTGHATPDALAFLFAELALTLKAGGFASLTLGMAPLTGEDARRGALLWRDCGPGLFALGPHFDAPETVRAFAEGFAPLWRPRFVASDPGAPPPMREVAALIRGGG